MLEELYHHLLLLLLPHCKIKRKVNEFNSHLIKLLDEPKVSINGFEEKFVAACLLFAENNFKVS